MKRISFFILNLLCLLVIPAEASITVSTVSGLVAAINNTQQGGDKTILIEDGVYPLGGHYLRIVSDGVSVRSLSGQREKVILDGEYQTTEIFQIVASNVSLSGITLKRARDHAVHVMGGAGGEVNNTLMEKLHVIDAGEQAIKINPSGGFAAHFGSIRDSMVEMTAAGRDYVEKDDSNSHPCYTGGIDAHGANGWTVQDNLIRGFWCSTGLSEHAIHFWSDSSNTLVQRNQVIDCDRGIGFGLGSRGHSGGIIRNNMISQLSEHGYSDVGIGLESASGAQVYNNTIFLGHDYPNAIEYRFSTSQDIQIANNLSNRPIRMRDGATASLLSHNVTHAADDWFIDPVAGDLHLKTAHHELVNSALIVPGLSDDFDKQPRPHGGGFDIGADEYGAGPGKGLMNVALMGILTLMLH